MCERCIVSALLGKGTFPKRRCSPPSWGERHRDEGALFQEREDRTVRPKNWPGAKGHAASAFGLRRRFFSLPTSHRKWSVSQNKRNHGRLPPKAFPLPEEALQSAFRG